MNRTTLCFSLSTWTQQDPVGGSLGNPNSLDRYVCTQDDPVNLSDPSGRISSACGWAIAGALVDVIGTAAFGELIIPASLAIGAFGLTAALAADQSPLSFGFGFAGLGGSIVAAAFGATPIGFLFDAANLVTACGAG